MKQSSTLKSFLTSLVFFLLISNGLFSQVCGNITLTTQAQVNAFACTSINGNLTIQDNGTDPITTLEPLYILNGAVDGSVFVQNCPVLTTLQGLDEITKITGDFRIVNCPQLTTFGDTYNFSLTSVGNFFIFQSLPKLTNVDRLNQLQSVGNALAFQYACGLTNFAPFNTLTSCPWIEFFQTTQSSLNLPFNGLSKTSYLRFFNNAASSIVGFNNLTSIVSSTSPSLVGQLLINTHPNLTNFSINPGFSSAKAIEIRDNPKLASCCFVLPLLASNPSPINISNNAFGCASLAQIDAPPILSACPADQTISVNSNDCRGVTSANSPTVSDNCDLAAYRLDILLGDGTSVNNVSISSGINLSFNLPSLLNKVTYKALDSRGNQTTCSFNITVEDNTPPVISNIPADVTIKCNDPFPSVPSPLFSDNCDDDLELAAASSLVLGECGLGEVVEIQEYIWTAIDDFGNQSTATWKVTRTSDFSFNLGSDVTVCDGSNYVIDPFITFQNYQWSTGATSQAISVNTSGTYSLTITTPNGCCFVDEINVNIIAPPNATATGATLDCGAESVQIMGSSSAPGVTYSWTGPGGFSSNEQNPVVPSVGNYTLTVETPEGCSSTATATVEGDTDVPDASALGGTIDCDITSIQLSGSSTTADVSYAWSGPDGFTSNDQNPIVNAPGLYVLSVTGTNGCTATVDAVVVGDTIAPMPMLSDGLLTCNETSLEYAVEGTAIWSGPGGFASLAGSVAISSPGTYMVTVTAANSCSSTTSFVVSQDTMPPNISAEGGIISCTSGQDTLKGSSTTVGAIFEWSGPGGFTTNIQNPIATTIGTYTLMVTSPNGCTATQNVELSASLDAPQVEASGGTIDCINTTLDLFATSPDEGLTYSWTGPNDFTAEGDSIQVSVPGNYTVNASNEDGCVGSALAQVIDNATVPEVSISASNLNCLEGATRFTTTVSEGVISFTWSGPNDFVSTEKEPEVTAEGLYTLMVTASNGCINTDTLTLISDVENPDATATGGMLTCTVSSIEVMGATTTADATFKWQGPASFLSVEQNPIVSTPGTYFLTVIAPNGCTATDSAVVTGDPNLPIVSISGGTINCITEEVVLMSSEQASDATIRWEGPNGFVSTSANPIIDIPGTYTFTVTSAGNCIASADVEVLLDKKNPDLTLAQGFIDCEQGEREFAVVTSAREGTFNWSGPDGFTSDLLNPIYTKAGTYMLTVTGSNGCSTPGAITVSHDIPYDVTLVITGNDATVETLGGTPPFTILFDGSIAGPTATDLSDGDHFVQITDGLDCSKTIEFTIMSSSVFDQEEALEVKVYPNPAQDILYVDWQESDLQAEKLSIMNSSGQIQGIHQVVGKNHQLNVDQYPPGIYYLKIEGKQKLTFKKFLKM